MSNSALAEKLLQEADLVATSYQIKKYNKTVAELHQKASTGGLSAEEYKKQLLAANALLLSKATMGSTPPPGPVPVTKRALRDWTPDEKQRFNDVILAMVRNGMNDKQIHAQLSETCSLSYIFKVRTKAGLASPFVPATASKNAQEPAAPPKVTKPKGQDAEPMREVPLVEREARFQERVPTRMLRHRPGSFYFPAVNKVLQVNFYDKTTDSWILLVSRQTWQDVRDAALLWLEEYPVMKLVLINSGTLSEFLPSAVENKARTTFHRNFVAFAQAEQLGD